MSSPNYDLLLRFELRDGQFFADYLYKNLHWHLDGVDIGYGDLRIEDVERIAKKLRGEEEFVGWNEHHGTSVQQTKTPMVRIRAGFVALRQDIVKAEGF